MSSCALCGNPFDASGQKQCPSLPLCGPCYEQAFAADMATVRQLKFEAADFIVDNIYLGPEGSTIRLDYLREHNITRVITVAAHSESIVEEIRKHNTSCTIHSGYREVEGTQCAKCGGRNKIGHRVFNIDDSPDDAAVKELQDALPNILECIQSAKPGNVLVHCVSGISRSGSVLVAYVMKTRKLSFDDALSLVRAQRACVAPNGGFQAMLRNLTLFDSDLIGE